MGRITIIISFIFIFYSCKTSNDKFHKENGVYYSLSNSQKQLTCQLDIMFLELEASSKFNSSSVVSKLLEINRYIKDFNQFIDIMSKQDSLNYKDEVEAVEKKTQWFKQKITCSFSNDINKHVDSLIKVLEFDDNDYLDIYNKNLFYTKKLLDIQIIRYNIVMLGLNNFSNSSIKFEEPNLLFQSLQDTIYTNEKQVNYVFFGVNYMEYQKELVIDSAFINNDKVEITTNILTLQNSLKKVEFIPKKEGDYVIYGKLIFKLPDGTSREVSFEKSFFVINPIAPTPR